MMRNASDKLRGGYYTPDPIADFIVDWAVPDADRRSLEPSCGDGSFIKSLVCRYRSSGASPAQIRARILGVESYPQEAEKARVYGGTIESSDFFSFYQENIAGKRTFDAVVGNPPFIRYHDFEETCRQRAFSLVERAGIALNRLTNIWIPFLILSAECLSSEGRLGMVIPAELLQVDYAAETRRYLAQRFEHLTVITFRKLLFEGTQQEVILLLAEVSSDRKGIDVYELNDSRDLGSFRPDHEREAKELDRGAGKWMRYYLTNEELRLLDAVEKSKNVRPVTGLFDVNVGVVSGQNRFFMMDRSARDRYRLADSVSPIVGRAEQLKGIQLSEDDLQALEDGQKNVFLFTPDDVDEAFLPAHQRAYVSYGEAQGYHEGFKCRNRKRWYIVPQTWHPEAFMLRQIGRCPRMVLNATSATNTDTLYKIRFKGAADPRHIVSAFINSFTFAQCEVTGRSYGGGVMSFEPNEVRQLRIPMGGADRIDFGKVDDLIRRGRPEEALDHVDSIVLIDGLGLSARDASLLRNIWIKLSGRRLERKGNKGNKRRAYA